MRSGSHARCLSGIRSELRKSRGGPHGTRAQLRRHLAGDRLRAVRRALLARSRADRVGVGVMRANLHSGLSTGWLGLCVVGVTDAGGAECSFFDGREAPGAQGDPATALLELGAHETRLAAVVTFFACVAERQTLGAVDAAPIPGFAGSSPAACTIPDPVVAVLRGHEGITSRWERRGGDRVMFLHTDAAATARVHGPQRWPDEGLSLRPTSLHTRALRRSPSSPFPAIDGGRCELGRAHLSLRRSA